MSHSGPEVSCKRRAGQPLYALVVLPCVFLYPSLSVMYVSYTQRVSTGLERWYCDVLCIYKILCLSPFILISPSKERHGLVQAALSI